MTTAVAEPSVRTDTPRLRDAKADSVLPRFPSPHLGGVPDAPASRLGIDGPKLPAIHRPDRFERMAAGFEIAGLESAPRGYFLGGLGTTGYSWSSFAYQLHDRLAMGVSVHSLAGHAQGMEAVRNTRWRDWTNEIVRSLERSGPSICFGFSTGGLALLRVAQERPELIEALVLVAPAVCLRSKQHSISLGIADRIAAVSSRFSRYMRDKEFRFARFDENTPDLLRRAPRLMRIPGSTFIEVRRLQREVRRGLTALQCPVYLAVAQRDELVHPRAARMLKPFLSGESRIASYDAPHNIMLDAKGPALFKDVATWLADITAYDGDRERRGLPAPGKAKQLLLREILELSDRAARRDAGTTEPRT